MPAFAGKLPEREIAASMAHIVRTWPPGVRAYQAAQSPGGPTLAELPGEWHFPASCGYHLRPPGGRRTRTSDG